jgi:hypothetical protein
MCDHNFETGNFSYVKAFDHLREHEIYMCECGALVDISAAKNTDRTNAMLPMTPDEISDLLSAHTRYVADKVNEQLQEQLQNVIEKLGSVSYD